MTDSIDLRALLEASPNAYMLLDRDLRYVWANAAYLAVTGATLDQLVGRRALDAFPNDPSDPNNESAVLLRRSFEKVLETRERDVLAYIPYRVARFPGGPLEERFWSATHTPIRGPDGEVRFILQHTVDVTELHRLRAAAGDELVREEAGVLGRAEQVQRTNRDLDARLADLQRMFAQAPGFFAFLRGPDLVFDLANQAYLTMIGNREVLGRPLLDALPELGSQGFGAILTRVYETGTPFVGRGALVQLAATAERKPIDLYVDFVYQPITDAAGKVFGIMVQGNDITLRRKLEVEREALLESEQAARAEAERANRLKDEFLATVSHELRTPLNAMLGWVQLLRTGALDDERRRRGLETIERNARAQAEIIDDILDVSRIMSGKLQLDPERLDLVGVVETAVESARPPAQEKGLRLSIEADGPAYVTGDAVRLQQVVWNLLSNAIKFTPAGGSVDVSVRSGASEVVVSVKDSGEGIAKEFLPRVFERFSQAVGSKSRKHGGLGLGLAIVKQLAELHGGSVSAASDGPGHGATFTLRLPVATRWTDLARHGGVPAAPVAPARMTVPPQLAGLRLLVVDDDPDARELLLEMLRDCGMHLEAAGSAEEAMGAMRRQKRDLLLSDLGMPGEDGLALIRRVRALPADDGGHMPAVALTAYARPEDRTQALLAGFRAYVSKPVDRDELLAVLASVAPVSAAR